ncbi:MAG: type II toxin-antitoxin system RelE/ParE family toxin [Moorea sp. SIO3I7]|uniref:type II toxin-antitoxin system RelE family toxin n=1 Tax=unclassified Moorena TaxID=2683338 RepID=UPI0013C5CFF0|nr:MULTISPECIES: type II toxin-antitoxin system RelE/ParE family toxin [unclassified Moorena]NEO03937.1 type II toxin-antitoxin system RelE/ParE family toxin [Moorena sp. SIO3I7]NEO50556.1 type II toxin-antitoxin system RelE/ParE family toxin [Moorena sp. SIO4A3]NEO63804.1 type II toxin-antitoxin system RelE/ParE family toxin [Moorena sp. SIO4G2]NEO12782.1 type II toxin-antitoxin system RelE/ParE family toxin [Moorena sp. SIO3E8]NEP23595.1 type II toxin-antitoxin system RelE/ParE family toxin 
MTIKFRKSAIKFLESADQETTANIRKQLRQLVDAIENKSIIPFNDLDIKKMKGNWEGFYRLRIGKIRVIFTVDLTLADIEIYTIGFRGNVYKNR